MFKQFFVYGGKDDYSFEQLPKGYVFKVGMNPYNGKVFFDSEKHNATTRISLDLMREIVRACEELEKGGSADPVRDLMMVCNGENWAELFGSQAPVCIQTIRGRSAKNAGDDKGESVKDVKKAS